MPQLIIADFSPQLVWLVISFVALFFVMSKVALPRIGEVLEARQERVTSDLEKAESLRGEADDAIKAYETALAEARASAHNTAQAARDEMNTKAEAKRGEVEAKLAGQLAEADARIAAAREEAVGHIRTVASDTAKTVASRLIGVDLDDAAIEAAVAGSMTEGN
ncbi:MAG: F0F1 ATP synthase subunit B' [Alphaproteobacteria bacterium]|jgi:F-type H+-transporting ATPase subunit b|nr:F0F1 ATP synthase subunit B' [Alphaproteobacteria bacterium]MBT4083415.1 F0F1 ATP synthase subunit B' [Alphaproteobacteria bacterium]MBT4542933.1 F0F1 ATP synthase subunit B' [Alphaproteobacteria bacterium]MBT5920281.1 F0F1 ATP synthase subunit B' [Alphaproteobacteria bacterium]MBT6384485.1 F0F1 ATP synthase subunit B' [Alphaproteobacteria bacterium]